MRSLITSKILEWLHKNGVATSTQICDGLKDLDSKAIRSCLNWMSRTGRIKQSANLNLADPCRLVYTAIAQPGGPKTLERAREAVRGLKDGLTAAELTEMIGCSRRSANLALKTLADLGEVERTSVLQKKGCVEYYVFRRNEEKLRPLTAEEMYDNFIRDRVKQGVEYPQVYFRGLLLGGAEHEVR